jgi:hypothetical protein
MPTLLLDNFIVTCHGPRTHYSKLTTTNASCSSVRRHAAGAEEAVANVLGFLHIIVQCLTGWKPAGGSRLMVGVGFLLGDRSAGIEILAGTLAQIGADTTLHSSRRCSCELFNILVRARAICSRLCEGCMQHAADYLPGSARWLFGAEIHHS